MRLGWDRPGVVRATMKVEELAALVAGARMAATALAGGPAEQTQELDRVLAAFDRAVAHLGPVPAQGADRSELAREGGGTGRTRGRVVGRLRPVVASPVPGPVRQPGGAKNSRATLSGSLKERPEPYDASTMPPWATPRRSA